MSETMYIILTSRVMAYANSNSVVCNQQSVIYHHITPVVQQLHWLPARKRILFKILLLTYKALHGLAPDYITELLISHKPIRSLRSSSKLLLKPAITSTSYGDRSFSAAAPKLWNELPISIRSAKSLDVFKTLLKTHLFICN